MICRCGCKQLIRKEIRMHADWQGQQGCRGMAGNMLTISRSLTLVACSPTPLSSAPSATGGLPTLEMRGYNCVSLTMPAPSLSLSLSLSFSLSFSLSPLYLLIESEPAFNSPRCASSRRFSHPFHPTSLPLPLYSLAGLPPLPHSCSLNQ